MQEPAESPCGGQGGQQRVGQAGTSLSQHYSRGPDLP